MRCSLRSTTAGPATVCGSSPTPQVAPAPRLGLVTHAAIAHTGHRSLDEAAAAVLRRTYGLPQEQAEQLALAGTPVQVAHHLAEYVALGVEHLVVINDLTPWQQACDLLRETRDALAQISGT